MSPRDADEEFLALREKEQRLRAIFDQAAVGIVIAGLDGRLLQVNRRFEEILGWSADEFLDRTFVDLTHPDDLDETFTAVRRLVAGDTRAQALEKRYVRRDGTVVWSLTTVSLLRDDDGRPAQFIGVIEDITRRKEAEAGLREQARALERMSAVKDEFLATLSHELRTPLNAILGWAQLLRSDRRSDVDIVRGLEIIERNARVQAQLIDDLLDMSRITSGKLRLVVQRLQPASVIEAAIETVRPSADAKGVAIETRFDEPAGQISGDAGRMQQVFWNLLSNAVKFTPRGGRITVGLQRVQGYVEIRVSDTGVGITPEHLPHMFERFRQGDASTTRRFGGLGLGLAIVKSLVELHGGTVAAASPGEGLGTTVTVQLPEAGGVVPPRGGVPQPVLPDATVASTLPDPLRAERSIEPRGSRRPPAELTGLTVLVVDDQPDVRELIARVLQDRSAAVLAAAAAEEALALMETRRIDVLVSDISMPGIDGFELLRRVRALGDERGRVPAVALTAFARAEDRARALRAGFLVHVSKPVDPSELVATVASVAGRVMSS